MRYQVTSYLARYVAGGARVGALLYRASGGDRPMRCCIHRGSQQIGGSCVELAHGGQRLVLDLGLPLTANPAEDIPLPDIPGLADQGPDLLGVLVSRRHPDHYGLATRREPAVPLYCGERTAAILREAALFSPLGPDLQPAGFLRDQVPFRLGPFSVTPYLADHSAFDASSPIRPTTSTSR